MIQWLINNKEWVFSGIGVFVLGFFVYKRSQIKKISINQNTSDKKNNIKVGKVKGKVNISINSNNIENNYNQLDEVEVVKSLIIFLEDKRVLYSPYAKGCPGGVLDSIHEIREKIKDFKKSVDYSSWLFKSLTNMQKAIWDFDYYACKSCENPECCGVCEIYQNGCIDGLIVFRKQMDIEISLICKKLNIRVPGSLNKKNNR
jgi:hypothetical protein